MKKESFIEVVEMSAYLPPKISPNTNGKWTLFGDNNTYFDYVQNCYKNSPTNSGIINGFAGYIFGEGLTDQNGNFVTKILSRNDQRLLVKDYKLYGQCAVQVIWNNAKDPIDKKPVQMKYVSVRKLGLAIDEEGDTTGYWFSFNWNENKYAPKFFHKFDGRWKGNDVYEDGQEIDTDANVEILYIRRPTDEDFFATPDYEAGLVFADVEAELANASISHIQNGFQGGALVNCNGGVPPTEELKNEYKKKIISSLTGTGNSNKIIVSFNDNPEQAMTVDRIPVAELNAQYESFDDRAEKKLLVAHSAPAILFSGSRDGGGLGANSEEMVEATKSLYRMQIFPMREVILDGLQSVMDIIDDKVSLQFKDFEELETIEEVEPIIVEENA